MEIPEPELEQTNSQLAKLLSLPADAQVSIDPSTPVVEAEDAQFPTVQSDSLEEHPQDIPAAKPAEDMPQNHVPGGRFHKVCVYRPCSRHFQSNSRNTRFCQDDCQTKHQKQRKRRKQDYSDNRDHQLIWVQAHKLSRMVLDLEVKEGRRVRECDFVVDAPRICGYVGDDLQVHHSDGDFLNAAPTNLRYQCPTHHAKLDSDLAKSRNIIAPCQIDSPINGSGNEN